MAKQKVGPTKVGSEVDLIGPISVRVDEEGRLYIPDYGSHRVQIYKKEAYPLTEGQIAPLPRNPMLLTT